MYPVRVVTTNVKAYFALMLSPPIHQAVPTAGYV